MAKKRKLETEKISLDEVKNLLNVEGAAWVDLENDVVSNARQTFRGQEDFQKKQDQSPTNLELCIFEELQIDKKPVFVARCKSKKCREKTRQQYFLTHTTDSNYTGRSFKRHLSQAIFGASSTKPTVSKASKNQPSMIKFATPTFRPELSDEGLHKIRRCQAKLIASGVVPQERFSGAEMTNLFEAIIEAVTPENTLKETTSTMAKKMSSSARTLGRTADEEISSLKEHIQSNAKMLAESGCATVMGDHQSCNRGGDTETVGFFSRMISKRSIEKIGAYSLSHLKRT